MSRFLLTGQESGVAPRLRLTFIFYRLAAEEEKYNNKKSEAEAQLAEYEPLFIFLNSTINNFVFRANERLSVKQGSGAREVARLTALLRKAEMNVSSMEEKIKQKVKSVG